MKRRTFVTSTSALAFHGSLSARNNPAAEDAEYTQAQLRLNPAHSSNTMPEDLVGLSYETAQLQNPDFFSPENTELVRLFSALSPRGVLRLGGNLRDYTFWSAAGARPATAEQQQTATNVGGAYEWKLVDSVAAQPRYTLITPQAIANLGDFLKRTGWRLIYGFNLGLGTPDRAAEETACVYKSAGSHLLAFQVGNEADFFAPRHRPKPYTFDQYWTE